MKISSTLILYFARFAIAAVIKRAGSQLVENSEGADLSRGSSIVPENCGTIPDTILSTVLGPAYNVRYMSINDPRDNNIEPETKIGVTKRKTGKIPSFYVEEEFNSALSNDPAWDFGFSNMKYEDRIADSEEVGGNTAEEEMTRDVRYVKNTPWQCESEINWIDLGRDYFPRYLRTVECAKSNCWYGFYTCKPKSFTVKLLRRRNGVCVPAPSVDELILTSKLGFNGLPNELRELWVWEERAVNFCCECAAGS